jgi:hypothetical protein
MHLIRYVIDSTKDWMSMPAVTNTTAPVASEGDQRAAAAGYIATLAADLAAIAQRHGLDTLGYILDMARLEAENASGKSGGHN